MLCAILSCKIYFHCTISGSRKWDEQVLKIPVSTPYEDQGLAMYAR